MHLSVCYNLISVQYFENMIILIKNICAGLWNYSLILLSVALILSGCIDDPLGNTVLPPVPEGCVRLELNLSVDESQKIVTRATDTEEKAYDPAYVWVLVFNTDPDPKLMEPPVKATPGSNEQFYAILRVTSQGVLVGDGHYIPSGKLKIYYYLYLFKQRNRQTS